MQSRPLSALFLAVLVALSPGTGCASALAQVFEAEGSLAPAPTALPAPLATAPTLAAPLQAPLSAALLPAAL
ncbi:MAG: hypothetical protein KGL53_13490, partial [Elusimicrobia bacterium]|nr:hypothetical protein [Elusimicrobiota bacterium]